MGLLTLILVRNDCVGDIREHPKEAVEGIVKASGNFRNSSISVGSAVNAMEALATCHADTPRVIVVYGNTWVDICREVYSDPDPDNKYLQKCLKEAEKAVKAFKKALKKS